MSFYPTEWDVTPITLIHTTKSFDGISKSSEEEIDIRLEFNKKFITDEFGNKVLSVGSFFKYGDLTVEFGSNFNYIDSGNTIKYTVKRVSKHRDEDGSIEYTEVMF